MTNTNQIRIQLMATDAEPKKFTAKQLYGCISTEIAMRITVYPNRVATGKMTIDEAIQEMQMMKTIRNMLEKTENEKQPDLFA